MKKTLFIVLSSIFLLSCLTSKNPVTNCENSNLEFLKKIALDYTPYVKTKTDTTEGHCAQGLPKIPKQQLDTISCLARNKNKEVEKYLSLIFVKLYRQHLEDCHLSQYIGRNRLKSIYWLYFTEDFRKNNREYTTSTIGMDWVLHNPELSSFKPIADQIKIIEKLINDLDDGYGINKSR